VARALDAAAVEYLVVGSVAAAVWGVARTTRDVDLVAVVPADRVDALLEELAADDLYVPVDDARAATRAGGSFNVLHPASGGKVDVFVAAADDAFERMRLERRQPADLFGTPTWVASPEDVVLAKLRWRLVTRSEVQWRDCVEIAATHHLDRDHLWAWADQLGVRADLAELIDEG
jgi:hypothetical protein